MTKHILSAASLMAVGLMAAQTARADDKIWNVSATLRGFYDDNYATSPSSPSGPVAVGPRSSFGFELSPSAGLNLQREQTTLTANYIYSMRYFDDRVTDSADHSHQLNAKLNHNFSPRYRIDVTESFAVAQEPQLLDPTTLTRPLRSDGNNIRNIAGLTFGADVTPLLTLELGYQNGYYDYQQTGLDSLSARLDRMENQFSLNSRWNIQPTTVGIFGYQYSQTDMTSNDQVFSPVAAAVPVNADTRDSRSHYLYVGADHSFTPQFNGSLRIGGQYTEFPNHVAGTADNTISPYVDVNGSYSYGNGSFVQLGVKHNRSSTDISTALDQEATSIYGSLNHKITSKLTANVVAQYQLSEFYQGPQGGANDNYFSTGLNLSYEINQYFSAETGYNYDRLDSNVSSGNRSYTRNRVYIGFRATY